MNEMIIFCSRADERGWSCDEVINWQTTVEVSGFTRWGLCSHRQLCGNRLQQTTWLCFCCLFVEFVRHVCIPEYSRSSLKVCSYVSVSERVVDTLLHSCLWLFTHRTWLCKHGSTSCSVSHRELCRDWKQTLVFTLVWSFIAQNSTPEFMSLSVSKTERHVFLVSDCSLVTDCFTHTHLLWLIKPP